MIGQHRFWRWLGRCLMAPSHYLNQCWLIINKVLWHYSESTIIRRSGDTSQQNKIKSCFFKITSRSPSDQWVKLKDVSSSDLTEHSCICIEFHRPLFHRVQLTVSQHWSRLWLGAILNHLCQHIGWPIQERRNYIANALEWYLSCTIPSIGPHRPQWVDKCPDFIKLVYFYQVSNILTLSANMNIFIFQKIFLFLFQWKRWNVI